MIIVNKPWQDSMTNPVDPPSLELKGGKSITFRSRLIILLGGQLKAGIKRLSATSKGFDYNYAIQTKAQVIKNQLPTPYNVSYKGEFICTDIGIIGIEKDEVDAYKKQRMPVILEKLNEIAKDNGKDLNFSANEVSFEENDEDLVVE